MSRKPALLVSLLLLAGVLAALLSPGVASTHSADHEAIRSALARKGILLSINDSQECKESYDGVYLPFEKKLIVCQDNGTANGLEVPWTANDLDTLRHEAHHVVQDCANGKLGDGHFSNMFNPGTAELQDFLGQAGLTGKIQKQISFDYRSHGADQHTINLELEAYAVAHAVPPELIAQKLDEVCKR